VLVLTRTVDFLEVLWTLIALLGLGINLLLVIDYWGDRRYALADAEESGVPIARSVKIIIHSNLRKASSFLVILLVLATIGVIQMFVPPRIGTNASLTQSISRWLLVLAEIWIVVDALLDRRDRRALIREELGRTPVAGTANPPQGRPSQKDEGSWGT